MIAKIAPALAAIMALNAVSGKLIPQRYPEGLPRAFQAESGTVGGTRDLVLTSVGLRSLAANLAMVDLLIYYGSHGAESEDWHFKSGFDQETGMYQDLFPLARRILGINPFFRYAILYASTALAFNEARDGQSVSLLKEALAQDLKYWPYTLNLSAIAYKKTKNYPELVRLLEEVYVYPECPTMLKNILGNIYLKTGKVNQALAIFDWMAQSAPEDDYRMIAQEKVERLRRKVTR